MNNTVPITPTSSTPAEPIHHSMLVSDISRQYPQCRPVFEKYGIAGCGGEYGPPEPLFIFAAAHRVPLRELVDELNRALRGKWKDESAKPTATAATELASENLYKRFVFGALFVALTVGFGLGVVNLTRISLAQSYYEISGVLKQIHGHAQIFGWVGLFIMGVAFHAVPRIRMQPLRPVGAAKWCFVLMLVGVLVRVIAQPLAQHSVGATALLISGAMELAAIGLFVWLLGGSMARSQQKREFHEKFIWASVAWFAVLGVWNFWIVLQMSLKQSVGIPALADALWIHVAFFGFIANMIFGFSLRVLPHFLGLRDSKTWAANVAFVSWNAAIFFRYPVEQLAWIASVLEAVAIVLFVWALGVFAPRRTKIEIKGVDNTFAWFVKLGYAWLLIAAVTPFHADLFRLSASARHTMAIGFVTPLIFGVELPRVADLQRRESLEQSTHARIVLVPCRRQHAGLLDGLEPRLRNHVELRLVGHRGFSRVHRTGDVRGEHRGDAMHTGREIQTGIHRQAHHTRRRTAGNPSRDSAGPRSWRAGRPGGHATQPAPLRHHRVRGAPPRDRSPTAHQPSKRRNPKEKPT